MVHQINPLNFEQKFGLNNRVNNQIKFKTIMLRPSLCDYSDSYILVKGKITITGQGADGAARQADKRDNGVVFKNSTPFTN